MRRDFYTLQYGPKQVEFGHVCEDPNDWEQRFERKDLDKQHHQGQVQRVHDMQRTAHGLGQGAAVSFNRSLSLLFFRTWSSLS